ncbi:MAG: hypothetical protein NT105_15465 [Verrucomicrobia bacterium]|nr:hypothetical protein [Verrucomicrobiota bacterium]
MNRASPRPVNHSRQNSRVCLLPADRWFPGVSKCARLVVMNRKKYRYVYILCLLSLLSLPQSASAHSPGAFMGAGVTIFILAAFLSALAKWQIVARAIAAPEAKRPLPYLGLGAIEFIIMLCAVPSSFYLTSSRNTYALLSTACIVYLLIAPIPNFLFLKRLSREPRTHFRMPRSLAYAIGLTLVFPIFTWVSTLGALGFLYQLFGG